MKKLNMIVAIVLIVIKKSNQIIGYIIDVIENAANLLAIIKSKNKKQIIQAIAIIIAIQLIENNMSTIDAVMIEIAKTIYQYNTIIKNLIIDLNMVAAANYCIAYIALMLLILIMGNGKAAKRITMVSANTNSLQLALLDKFYVSNHIGIPEGITMRSKANSALP